MNTARSKDGTPLAYDQFGKGPTLILVNGAMATQTDATKTAESLGQHFTVFAYDRRGRGRVETQLLTLLSARSRISTL